MYQTLIELYNKEKEKHTPAELFIREVAKVSHRALPTVYKWVTGKTQPDTYIKQKLSRHFNIPVENLFPGTTPQDDEQR